MPDSDLTDQDELGITSNMVDQELRSCPTARSAGRTFRQPRSIVHPAALVLARVMGATDSKAKLHAGIFIPSTYRPGTLATGQLHNHRKHIFGIIAALLVGLIIGGIIGFSFPIAADYTNLTGTVSLGNHSLGSPDLIMFNSTIYGSQTSAGLADHSYQVNLPVGDTYNVSIQWFNASSGQFGNCEPSPSTFSSNNQNASQNYSF